WGEADRMKGLAITKENLKNQQEVVKNEVKVNVLNQPYGGFPWLDMPQYANTNWYNAHNFYGDLKDLDAATLEDVQSFFKTYYAPNNAALVVVGDFEPKQTLEWIKKYFGSIAAQPQPAKPDISEPEQTGEKKSKKQDPLATRPAVAVAYQMPARNTPEYYAMGLLDQILVQGEDSKLHQALVQKKGYTGQVSGGINYLGNMFNYNGPMLWMMDLIHDQNVSADSIMLEVDRIMQELAEKPVDQATLNRALVKMRSSLYGEFNQTGGLGKMDLLACFALFDDNPARINTLEDEFRKVTPELIRETAKKYLRSTNRTILSVEATNVMKNKMGAAQ
ncbi:MAG TPA: insulinase family protein, partial [bacterium]|nr:insulinase family protein [bacterium]